MNTNGKAITRITCIHAGREATIEEVRNVHDVDMVAHKVADIHYQTAPLPVSVPVEEINDITVYFDDGTNEFLGDPVIPVHIHSIARAEVSA